MHFSFLKNLPAFLIVLLVISILIKGTQNAAKANNMIVILKVSAVLFVIIAGAFFINFDNWSPFIPEATQIVEKETTHNAYGLTGIVSRAAANSGCILPGSEPSTTIGSYP